MRNSQLKWYQLKFGVNFTHFNIFLERWFKWGSEANWKQETDQDFICDWWQKSPKLYYITVQIENVWWRNYQVSCSAFYCLPCILTKKYFRSILSMDRGEQLPMDMVEQLLKFTPSAEERALLDEHSDDADSLARADRFLYEISRFDLISIQNKLSLSPSYFCAGFLTLSRGYAVCTSARSLAQWWPKCPQGCDPSWTPPERCREVVDWGNCWSWFLPSATTWTGGLEAMPQVSDWPVSTD